MDKALNFVFISLNSFTYERTYQGCPNADKFAIDNGEDTLKALIHDYDVAVDTVTFKKQAASKTGIEVGFSCISYVFNMGAYKNWMCGMGR